MLIGKRLGLIGLVGGESGALATSFSRQIAERVGNVAANIGVDLFAPLVFGIGDTVQAQVKGFECGGLRGDGGRGIGETIALSTPGGGAN